MVTATLESKRLPHAIQSGPAAASLWLVAELMSAVLLAVLILLLPTAGRHFVLGDGGVLEPDGVLIVGVPVVIGAVAAYSFIERRVRSALAMRTPGMLAGYATREAGERPTRIPGWIASLLKLCVGLGAAVYAATHAAGDHGIAALNLILFGVFCVGSSILTGVALVIRRRPGWSADLLGPAILELPWGVGLFLVGRNMAPRGELASAELVSFFIVAMAVVCATWLGVKFAIRAIRDAGGGSDITDFAEEAAEGILARYSAAPTVKDRQRAHAIGRFTLYAVFIAAGVLLIGIPIIS